MLVPVYRREALDLISEIQVPFLYIVVVVEAAGALPWSPGIVSVAANSSNLHPSPENCSWPMGATWLEMPRRLYFPSRASLCTEWLTDKRIQNLSPFVSKGTNLWCHSHSRTSHGIRLKLDFNWNFIFVSPLPLLYPASLPFSWKHIGTVSLIWESLPPSLLPGTQRKTVVNIRHFLTS